jgi:hypothetical protein
VYVSAVQEYRVDPRWRPKVARVADGVDSANRDDEPHPVG